MKTKNTIILLTILCLMFFSDLKAQSFDINTANERYWYYRERLMFFMKPGIKQGESNVAAHRNQRNTAVSDRGIHYGDQPLYLSYYIGVLATEYKLLYDNHNINGVDNSVAINNTLLELYYAFEAFKRMDECEEDPPWLNTQTDYDGFFARDVVVDNDPPTTLTLFIDEPGNMEYFNKDLSLNQSYPDGHPDYIDWLTSNYGKKNNAMSKDLAIYSLIGFALTVKCLPDQSLDFYDYQTETWYSCNFEERAQTACHLLVSFLSRSSWAIRDPDGDLVNDGWWAWPYRYGFCAAERFICQQTYLYHTPILTGVGPSFITWQGMQENTGVGHDYNKAMKLTLAAVSDSWRLPVFPFNNTTFLSINNIGSSEGRDWQTFYTLLWQYLHDKNKDLEIQRIEEQLASAPCGGPFSYVKDNGTGYCASGGWGSVLRWRCGSFIQNHGDKDFPANYNGLDYMLFYNLYRLVEHPIGYRNLIDYYDNLNYPYFFPFPFGGSGTTYGNNQNIAYIQAFNTLTSISKIYKDQNSNGLGNGNVIFRAGESITLKPGFHAQAGCYFHAYIDPLECNGGQYRNSAYSNMPMFTVYDSLSCAENYVESINFENLQSEDDYNFTEPLSDNHVSVFPNPTSGIFTVVLDSPMEVEVQIQLLNPMGEVLYNKTQNGFTSQEIDISAYQNGVYVLYFISANIKYTKTIILTK